MRNSRSNSQSNREEFTIAVIGGGGVGKSALIIRFIQNVFVEEYDSSTGDGNNCLVKIIDTVGQEEHKPLEESYMRNAEGFLLVFSINDKSSFERIQSFHEQILGVKDADKGSVPMILVGNKSDMDSKRTVTTNEAVEYSKKINIQYLESSAKERINVDEAFLILVKQIKKNRAPVQVPVPEKSEKAQKKDCIIA